MIEFRKTEQIETVFRSLPVFVQQHSRMVGQYAKLLVAALSQIKYKPLLDALPAEVLAHIDLLGKYHDIGKAAIPDAVLSSARPLADLEWKLMYAHTLLGAYMILDRIILPSQESSSELWEIAAQCCQYHHERWDGKGYPFGFSGESIPLPARIIGIADAYDAMTADRPYHKGISEAAALVEIQKGAGTQFDPLLAEVFVQAISKRTNAVSL